MSFSLRESLQAGRLYSSSRWYRQWDKATREAYRTLLQAHPAVAGQYARYFAHRDDIPHRRFMHFLQKMEEVHQREVPLVRGLYGHHFGSATHALLRYLTERRESRAETFMQDALIYTTVHAARMNQGVPLEYVYAWLDEFGAHRQWLGPRGCERIWEDVYARHINTPHVRTAARRILEHARSSDLHSSRGEPPIGLVHIRRGGIFPGKLLSEALRQEGLKEGVDFVNSGVRVSKGLKRVLDISDADLAALRRESQKRKLIVIVDGTSRSGTTSAFLKQQVDSFGGHALIALCGENADIPVPWLSRPDHPDVLADSRRVIHHLSEKRLDVIGEDEDGTPREGPMQAVLSRAIQRAFSRTL